MGNFSFKRPAPFLKGSYVHALTYVVIGLVSRE